MRLRAMKKQTQNKPNFRKAKMNINLYVTKDYENETTFRLQKNKPKQKTISNGTFLPICYQTNDHICQGKPLCPTDHLAEKTLRYIQI